MTGTLVFLTERGSGRIVSLETQKIQRRAYWFRRLVWHKKRHPQAPSVRHLKIWRLENREELGAAS
jgi:hypothetical protein